jgi:outer membrane protein, heavy metal efflux system
LNPRAADRSSKRETLRGSAIALLAAVGSFACTAPLFERAAREDLAAVREQFRPVERTSALPTLTPESALQDYLRFAMLNSPRVESAYFAWAAEVEAITSARTPADPRLTLESDIADSVESLMTGLMIELPGLGKLRLAGAAQAAKSQGAYFAFEQELLRTSLAVKTAYYRAHFLEESIRVQRATLDLLIDLERLAQLQSAAGRATLQDVLRSQIARDQVGTQIENLEDSRSTLVAELKAALGLRPADRDPPMPSRFEASSEEPSPDELLALAMRRNPQLRAMEADVRRAEAELALARRAGIPDFSLGIEVDTEADPTVFTPQAEITLPIWRAKLRAQIAAAQASKQSVEARLGAEQVALAAELASLLYTYRQAVRNQTLLRDRLLPAARQSLEAARAGYVNGRSQFLDVIDAQRSLLEFELAAIDVSTQRELALASLSLSIAGAAPPGAPTLPAASPGELPGRATP